MTKLVMSNNADSFLLKCFLLMTCRQRYSNRKYVTALSADAVYVDVCMFMFMYCTGLQVSLLSTLL